MGAAERLEERRASAAEDDAGEVRHVEARAVRAADEQQRTPAMRILAITAATGLGLGLTWLALDILLLVFGGILLAVYLRALAGFVQRVTTLPPGLALLAGGLVLLALLAGGATLLSRSLMQQTERLGEEMPRAVERARTQVEQYPFGRWTIENLPEPANLLAPRQGLMSATTIALSGTIGVVGTLLIILFIGIYLAAQPDLYLTGALRLVPIRRRARVAEVLDELGATLRWWLVGKLLAMTLIGVATTLGLLALGIPAPVALGLIAAVLTFIPNFGPVIAAAPAVLLGLLSGTGTALWVLALYVGIQFVESYLVTPMVQKRTVSLPPALTIAAQVVIGVAAGVLGLALATPLVAVGLVAIRELYVADVLGNGAGHETGG